MPDQERDLSPERESQVRRLLSEVRADESTPPDVVRRLNGVLDGLVAERIEPAIDLAARRRRRRVSTFLVAAATVVAVGVGIDQVIDGSGSDSASTAMESGDEAAAADSQEAPDRSSGVDGLQGDVDQPPPADEAETGRNTERSTDEMAPFAIALGGGGLTEAVQQVVRAARGATVGESGFVDLSQVKLGSRLTMSEEFSCTPADWGPGRLVPVLYKGTPNVLALRVPQGNTQVVELLQCGTGEVVRSLTLPTG